MSKYLITITIDKKLNKADCSDFLFNCFRGIHRMVMDGRPKGKYEGAVGKMFTAKKSKRSKKEELIGSYRITKKKEKK